MLSFATTLSDLSGSCGCSTFWKFGSFKWGALWRREVSLCLDPTQMLLGTSWKWGGCDASLVCCTAELMETYGLLSSVPLAFWKQSLLFRNFQAPAIQNYSETFFFSFLLKTLSRICQHAGSHKHVKLFGSGKWHVVRTLICRAEFWQSWLLDPWKSFSICHDYVRNNICSKPETCP